MKEEQDKLIQDAKKGIEALSDIFDVLSKNLLDEDVNKLQEELKTLEKE